MDLFESASVSEKGIPKSLINTPLAVRMRPKTAAEVLGQEHLLKPGSPLLRLIADDTSSGSSIILYGPPGTGKTTLAYLIASSSARKFVELSAVSDGVKQVRAVIEQAKRDLVATGRETVLFIDEVHRFSKSQQDALLPAVENRWVILVAATTENPSFSVVSPLLSRSLLLNLNPLSKTDIRLLLQRALTDERGLGGEFSITEEALNALIDLAGVDARRGLTLLEAAADNVRAGLVTSTIAGADASPSASPLITAEAVQAAADSAVVRYDQNDHYDVISAFIKSMRGSDVDAALHYLARMIVAGEDPRFIARRIMICAAEDVGLADPTVLPLCVAVAQGVALIGMPEGRILLSEAVTAVCLAPKSNSTYLAIDRAIAEVKAGKIGEVPPHLRDTHYSSAEKMGAKGYKYAHSYPNHIVEQSYLPAQIADSRFYEPTDCGMETKLGARWELIRKALGRKN